MASLLYENDFQRGAVGSQDIGTLGDNSDIGYDPTTSSPPDQLIALDPADAGKQVYCVTMDQSPSGYNLENNGTDLKHRAMIVPGAHLTNDMEGEPHSTNTSKLRFLPDKEYWWGYRVRFDVSADYNRNNWNQFWWGLMSSNVGAPAFYFKKDGAAGTIKNRIMFQRYKDENGTNQETKDYVNLNEDEWYDIVIRVLRKPYSLGTYIDGVVGGTPSGIGQLWVNGVLTVDRQGIYTGTDREHQGVPNDFSRIGIYNGIEDDATSEGEIKIYFDDLKIAEGADAYDMVDPSNVSAPAATLPDNSMFITWCMGQ